MTARSSNHSFSDGWLVMLQRICPVRLQSGRDPEFEHPEHCGGYVLSSESRGRAARRAFVWIDASAARPVPCCLFPIHQKIPKFGDPPRPKTYETKELLNGIVLALQR